jgi:uncharacterized protein
MKKSRYNLFFKNDSNIRLAFNFFTCQLSEIDDDFQYIYENIHESMINIFGNSDVYEKMIEGGYIIDDMFDEFEILKLRHYSSKCDSSSYGMIIAPTLDCNFGMSVLL